MAGTGDKDWDEIDNDVVFDMTDLEDDEEREKRKRRRRWTILIYIGCGIVAVAIIYVGIMIYVNRSFDEYEVIDTFASADSGAVEYAPYNGGLLRYSRDGASAYNDEGEVIWNGSYELSVPVADINGKYVLIYDLEGKNAYVFNGSDSGTALTTTKSIASGRVSAGGLVALLTDDTDSNTISLYNPYDNQESLLAEIPTNVTDGYPVDFAMSADGNSIIGSYMGAENGEVSSRVVFYNFSDVGKDKDSLVGAQNFGNTIVPKLEFLDEDTVCLFTIEGFSVWNNMKQPKKIGEVKPKKNIKSAFYDSGHVGLVLDRADSKEDYQLVLYNLNAKETMSVNLGFEYTNVRMEGGEIHMYSSSEWRILTTNGKWKVRCKTKGETAGIYPTTKRDTYFMVSKEGLQLVKLVRK